MTTPQIRAEIERAIGIAGSEKKLGDLTGYSQNAIWQAKRAGRVTGEMAAKIDRATDGQVPKHTLRPDLFEPRERDPAAPTPAGERAA